MATWSRCVAPDVSIVVTVKSSRVKVSDVLVELPAASVWLATTVWVPLARPVGVKVQAPDASAVAVAAMALPSTVK